MARQISLDYRIGRTAQVHGVNAAWFASTILAGRRQLSSPVKQDGFSPFFWWAGEPLAAWRHGGRMRAQEVLPITTDWGFSQSSA
jgi:hypothetical protein